MEFDNYEIKPGEYKKHLFPPKQEIDFEVYLEQMDQAVFARNIKTGIYHSLNANIANVAVIKCEDCQEILATFSDEKKDLVEKVFDKFYQDLRQAYKLYYNELVKILKMKGGKHHTEKK